MPHNAIVSDENGKLCMSDVVCLMELLKKIWDVLCESCLMRYHLECVGLNNPPKKTNWFVEVAMRRASCEG